MISTYISLVILACAPILFILGQGARLKKQHPPGPKGLPILGNLPAFLSGHWYETFSEWQNKYGK